MHYSDAEGFKMNKKEINQFLAFGYIIDENHSIPKEIANIHKDDRFDACNEDEIVQAGVQSWRSAIQNILADDDQEIVVPLSGGLDSRAILAGLLEFKSHKMIYTFTFGLPGTFDYEIGNLVANFCKTNHHSYNLNEYPYTYDVLEQISQLTSSNTMLFHHAPISLINRDFGTDKAHWSGFMGDPLAGSHLPPPSEASEPSWDQARKYFVEKNTYCRSISLKSPDINYIDLLPRSPLGKCDSINYAECLDFAIRQQCYVKPLVLLGELDYKLPFLHQNWVDFILNVPYWCRRNQYIYRKVLLKAYPKLFSLPVKNNGGLPLNAKPWQLSSQNIIWIIRSLFEKALSRWVHQPPLGTNFIDFNEGIRRRDDLNKLVSSLLQDLIKREIIDWIDIEDIWNKHIHRKANYADALTLLASLEVNLRMKKDPRQ